MKTEEQIRERLADCQEYFDKSRKSPEITYKSIVPMEKVIETLKWVLNDKTQLELEHELAERLDKYMSSREDGIANCNTNVLWEEMLKTYRQLKKVKRS